MIRFDPSRFWTDLPNELVRHLLGFVCRMRESGAPIREDHSDIHRAVVSHESDLVAMSTLRLTNREQPFRTNLVGNRVAYYELSMDVWTLRYLLNFRKDLGSPAMGGSIRRPLSGTQKLKIYTQVWLSLNERKQVIKAVAQRDPDVLKVAMRALKNAERDSGLHGSNTGACDW